ncbi:MAG: hypothetical protein ACLGIK_09080, partial [Gemmatimonadota bacterium]
ARLTGIAGGKAPAAPRPALRTSAGLNWGTLAIVVVLVAINVAGAPYYLRSIAERVRHPMHALLRPSGLVGQSAGIVAFLVFVFLWLYPLRKKWKALAFTGPVGKWLDVHVTTAIGLPLLLTIHAAWRSDGVIGLGFGAMLVVCASGVVGRYLYTRIPRAKSGVELTRDEVVAERNRLIDEIAGATGLHPRTVESTLDVASPSDEKAGVVRVLRDLVTNDVRRWRMTRELRRRFRELDGGRSIPSAALAKSVKLASREIALSQQVRMLEATHRVFRYWHIAHKPFALTALVAVVIHVAVVVAVGATWFY